MNRVVKNNLMLFFPAPEEVIISFFEVCNSLERSMNTEGCIVKMTDYLTNIFPVNLLNIWKYS